MKRSNEVSIRLSTLGKSSRKESVHELVVAVKPKSHDANRDARKTHPHRPAPAGRRQIHLRFPTGVGSCQSFRGLEGGAGGNKSLFASTSTSTFYNARAPATRGRWARRRPGSGSAAGRGGSPEAPAGQASSRRARAEGLGPQGEGRDSGERRPSFTSGTPEMCALPGIRPAREGSSLLTTRRGQPPSRLAAPRQTRFPGERQEAPGRERRAAPGLPQGGKAHAELRTRARRSRLRFPSPRPQRAGSRASSSRPPRAIPFPPPRPALSPAAGGGLRAPTPPGRPTAGRPPAAPIATPLRWSGRLPPSPSSSPLATSTRAASRPTHPPRPPARVSPSACLLPKAPSRGASRPVSYSGARSSGSAAAAILNFQTPSLPLGRREAAAHARGGATGG